MGKQLAGFCGSWRRLTGTGAPLGIRGKAEGKEPLFSRGCVVSGRIFQKKTLFIYILHILTHLVFIFPERIYIFHLKPPFITGFPKQIIIAREVSEAVPNKSQPPPPSRHTNELFRKRDPIIGKKEFHALAKGDFHVKNPFLEKNPLTKFFFPRDGA